MRRLRDDHRAEAIFSAFVLLLSVMAIFSVVSITFLDQMESSAERVNRGMDEGSPSMLDVSGYAYTLITPLAGYEVTTDNVTDEMVYPYDAPFVFTDTDHANDQKHVQVIRDNVNYRADSTDMWNKYDDFISVQRKVKTTSLTHDWNGAAISFETIVAHFDPNTNCSTILFDISEDNDTLFVLFDDNTTADLWTDNYTIYYGYSNMRPNKANLWNTVTMVATAQVPGLDWRIQFIVDAVWIFCLIFVGFTMMSRIIPTLGGG